jgi:hypothetical protein
MAHAMMQLRFSILMIFCKCIRQVFACVSIWLLLPVTAQPQTRFDDIARFNRDMKILAPDWMAENWRKGFLRLHPEKFNETADNYYMSLYGEEPVRGRTSQSVLDEYFNSWRVGDVDAERPVSMKGATEISDGILVKNEKWGSFEGTMVSFWGVIKTRNNTFIAFWAQCNMSGPKYYDGEMCVKRIVFVAEALKQGVLRLPQTEAPLYVPGWSGQYDADGVSRLMLFDWSGVKSFGRASWIYAAPSRMIPVSALQAAVLAFANKTQDAIDGTPQAPSWNGTIMSRKFPQASEGPSVQIGAAVMAPDKRSVIVSLRCYNAAWLNRCSSALKRVIRDIEAGIVQERVATWRQ